MSELYIKPMLDEPSAITATEITLRALPGGGAFARDSSGELLRVDGYLILECSDPGFVEFAAIQQGYVRECRRPGRNPVTP